MVCDTPTVNQITLILLLIMVMALAISKTNMDGEMMAGTHTAGNLVSLILSVHSYIATASLNEISLVIE